MNHRKYWLLILIVLILGCARNQPATTPIYDEKADARHDIAAAIAQAEASRKNLVLIFGANW